MECNCEGDIVCIICIGKDKIKELEAKVEELEISNKWHREIHATWDNWFKEAKENMLIGQTQLPKEMKGDK